MNEIKKDFESLDGTKTHYEFSEDNNGNRKLYKKRRGDKIDSVAALMDAFVAYKVFKDDF